jgi:hypothetical protein
MKQLTITLMAVLFVAGWANGQLRTPAPSPLSTVKQTVGLTDVEIEYSRPSMKDRKVFGGLVPFGDMWRTGANSSTKITFGNDVRIDGKDVKAGKYALLTIPGVDSWTIILYSDVNFNGVPNPYKEENEAVRLTAKPKKIDLTVESFLINIGGLRNSKASIEMMWENTLVAFDVDFKTDELVEASISRTMAGPSADDYYRAARYYMDEEKDLVQALGWARKSNEGDARYWRLFLQAQLEDKLMQYDAAVASATQSRDAANTAGATGFAQGVDQFIAEVKAKMDKNKPKSIQGNMPKSSQ